MLRGRLELIWGVSRFLNVQDAISSRAQFAVPDSRGQLSGGGEVSSAEEVEGGQLTRLLAASVRHFFAERTIKTSALVSILK